MYATRLHKILSITFPGETKGRLQQAEVQYFMNLLLQVMRCWSTGMIQKQSDNHCSGSQDYPQDWGGGGGVKKLKNKI
jgi:hypothetical protein